VFLFRFQIHSYPDLPIEIEIRGHILHLRQGWAKFNKDVPTITRGLTSKELDSFNTVLERTGFWKWDDRYDDNNVLDGFCWEITAKTKDKKIKTGGYNHAPDSWDQVDKAIMKLANIQEQNS